MPFRGPLVFLVFGVSWPQVSSSGRTSSARSKTSAKMLLSLVHFTSFTLLESTSILCFKIFFRYHASIWSRPLVTSSWCLCRAIRLSLPARRPCHKDSISSFLLTLSMPLSTSSSDTRLLLFNPRSAGTSPRYRYLNAIWKASGGIVFASSPR